LVTLEGIVAEVALDREPHRVKIFFTRLHAEAWQAV
jgi:hypothetical protein